MKTKQSIKYLIFLLGLLPVASYLYSNNVLKKFLKEENRVKIIFDDRSVEFPHYVKFEKEETLIQRHYEVTNPEVFNGAEYIYLGQMGDYDRVHLGDCEIGETGIVQDGKLERWWWFYERFYKLPDLCLLNESKNEIKIDFGRETVIPQGIMSKGIFVFDNNNIKSVLQFREYLKSTIPQLMALIVFFLFVYYGYVYLLIPTRKTNGIYSLICLFASFFLITLSGKPFRVVSAQELLFILHSFSAKVTFGGIIYFYRYVNQIKNHIFFKFYYFVSIVFLICEFIAWDTILISSLFSMWMVIFLIYTIYFVYRFAVTKPLNSNVFNYNIAICSLLFFVTIDIVKEFVGIDLLNTIPYGYFITLCWMGLILASDYANAFLHVEAQVADRTKDLSLAMEELKGLEKMKERLFANISHDLKTPITVAMGAVDEAKEKFSNVLGNTLAPAHRSLYKLQSMVQSILDVVKAEAGTFQLQWSPVEVKPMIEDVSEDIKILCKRHQVEFNANLEGIANLTVPMDGDIMKRVLDNVLTNAVKYTKTTDKPFKKVAILAKTDQSQLHIYIDDSGIGVPESEREAIFERFVQSSKTDLQTHGGSGIGLSFVKEMMEKHNGSAEMLESPWGGSRLALHLPLSQDVTLTNSIAAIDEKQLAGSLNVEYPPTRPDKINPAKPTLLSCEDNPEVAQIIYDALKEDYNLYTAENGEEGLKLLSEIQPDCILSDIQMHVRGGIEFLSDVRKIRHLDHVPFVFLTSLGADQDVIDGFSLGASDYIAKPFKKQVLKVRVRAHVERKIFFDRMIRGEKMSTIGTMFAGIAHEMKNPLQSLVNNHSMIAKIVMDKSFEEKYDILSRAIDSARKKTTDLTQLVSTVNEFSSGSENKITMDLKAKAQDVLMLLEAKRKEKDFVEVLVEAPDEPLMFEGFNSILQAMTNIVSNALDAVEGERGEIKITLSQTDTHVQFQCFDNGSGIKAEVLPYIFDPFVTTKDPTKGTGLGLFLTKTIIEEKHAGKIHVQTEVGKGTTFTLMIPKVASTITTPQKPFHAS